MKMTTLIGRRNFLLTTGIALAAAPLIADRAWANAGHGHEEEKSSKEHRTDEGAHGHESSESVHEAGAAAHGHEANEAPHGHGSEEAHGHGEEKPVYGHQQAESSHGGGGDGHAHGHGDGAAGHAGHNHGKGSFEKYGLVKAEKGFKEFNLKIAQYRFTPDTLRVDTGDRVRINLDSTDATHGFYIDGYGLNTLVPEKENKTVEFVADRAGAFRIRCSGTCGPFHPFMIGRFVVGENRLFWWGMAATILLPAAALIGLGWREEMRHEN
jgi:plastocyanin